MPQKLIRIAIKQLLDQALNSYFLFYITLFTLSGKHAKKCAYAVKQTYGIDSEGLTVNAIFSKSRQEVCYFPPPDVHKTMKSISNFHPTTRTNPRISPSSPESK